jgi:hypothetical protein
MDNNRYRMLTLFPLLSDCIYIIGATFFHEIEHAINASAIPVLFSFIFIFAFFVPSVLGLLKQNTRYIQFGLFSICALTPFSLIYPWVITPGNMGLSCGGYTFFLEWLTKYPNFGKINIEVFIGIASVLISSLLPAILSYLHNFKMHYRRIIIAMVIIEIAAYVPVLIKLDWLMFLSGIMGNSWLGGGTIRDLSVATGPSLRLVSFLMIAGAAIKALRRFFKERFIVKQETKI